MTATIGWITAALALQTRPDVAEFWAAVTGTRVRRSGERVSFETAGADAVLTGGPGAHDAFVLHVKDPGAACTTAESLGGRTTSGGLCSPGGLSFAVQELAASGRRPPVLRTESGAHVRLDQICLDIPLAHFEREADFWSACTGWPRRPGRLPEFDYLERPADQPYRFLLQRVEDAGPVRFHLDLACDDVAAETARHEALGASVVRRTAQWTTLRDPAGREYCITGRSPWTGATVG